MLEQDAAVTDLRARGARPSLAALHAHARLRAARDRARRGLLPLGRRRASATSTRSPASSRSTSATRTARRSARRRSRRCASCRSTPTGRTRTRARSSSRPSSRELAPRAHQPRVLRLRRLRGGRVGLEARAPVPHGARRAPLEGRVAPHRLPRHDDGRALDQRHRRAAHAVRAARPGRRPRAQHEPLPPARPTRPRRSSPRSCSTTSRRRSSQAGPETVAMVIFEPVQNAGGSFTPPAGLLPGRARDLRPLRDPALRRRGDHRLRAPRRLVRQPASTTSSPT